ncbi:hypothetical protein FOA43_000788 [Brettanomyces nanus]|uniref:Bromo domain-containing protein n=1 Tax=Eeniella nana TaxID=13502 RepID=A0A875RTG7_EENNA|nr:uncharacterized protein FOA43_000788 [Brettanomyces nanus]QPG73477.1 hypothetical protein FOA43_000788 [Brettanomyces nanus]
MYNEVTILQKIVTLQHIYSLYQAAQQAQPPRSGITFNILQLQKVINDSPLINSKFDFLDIDGSLTKIIGNKKGKKNGGTSESPTLSPIQIVQVIAETLGIEGVDGKNEQVIAQIPKTTVFTLSNKVNINFVKERLVKILNNYKSNSLKDITALEMNYKKKQSEIKQIEEGKMTDEILRREFTRNQLHEYKKKSRIEHEEAKDSVEELEDTTPKTPEAEKESIAVRLKKTPSKSKEIEQEMIRNDDSIAARLKTSPNKEEAENNDDKSKKLEPELETPVVSERLEDRISQKEKEAENSESGEMDKTEDAVSKEQDIAEKSVSESESQEEKDSIAARLRATPNSIAARLREGPKMVATEKENNVDNNQKVKEGANIDGHIASMLPVEKSEKEDIVTEESRQADKDANNIEKVLKTDQSRNNKSPVESSVHTPTKVPIKEIKSPAKISVIPAPVPSSKKPKTTPKPKEQKQNVKQELKQENKVESIGTITTTTTTVNATSTVPSLEENIVDARPETKTSQLISTPTTPEPSARLHHQKLSSSPTTPKSKGSSVAPSRSSSRKRRQSDMAEDEIALQHSRKRFQTLSVQLLSQISSNRFASMFLQPVNSQEEPHYYKLIKIPVDLKTLLKDVRAGTVTTFEELEFKLQLMFSNAVMYNDVNQTEISSGIIDMMEESHNLLKMFKETIE